MSAQRRTASKRDATATPRRAPSNGPAAAPAPATRVVGTGGQRPPTERPPKPVVAERARTAPAERGAFAERIEGLRRLYGDTLAEMKKINWPDRETTKNLTLVVIGVSAALGILLGGIDFLLQSLFEAF